LIRAEGQQKISYLQRNNPFVMKRAIYTFIFLIFGCTLVSSQDTFSVIAVDPETGQVGAAGATCVDGIAQWGGIQLLNKIIPGKGGVNAQAWICLNPHINLDNAISKMDEGLNPDEIITWLTENDACSSQNYDPAYRQYGVVDFDDDGNPRAAAFTGESADDYKGHRVGETYAIQGNILLGAEVLDDMETGYMNEDESLAHKLMSAMQGANVAGADVRCLNRGTSSTSAFLRVMNPDDDPNNPYLELSILEMPFGMEPIDSLQNLFNEWTASVKVEDLEMNNALILLPNPTSDKLQVSLGDEKIETYGIYSNNGQAIQVRSHLKDIPLTVDVSSLVSGKYILRVRSKNRMAAQFFFKD
jgi:uncharacterized Ntn-hydrolase superfamily protein